MTQKMTVADLAALLATLPQDLPIEICQHSRVPSNAYVRERVDIYSGKVETFAAIGDSTPYPSLPCLTPSELARQRKEILERMGANLYDCKYQFTAIHGDYRLYNPTLGSQATCYGTTYDPRVFNGLVADGLLTSQGEGSSRTMYITESGREAANAKKAA